MGSTAQHHVQVNTSQTDYVSFMSFDIKYHRSTACLPHVVPTPPTLPLPNTRSDSLGRLRRAETIVIIHIRRLPSPNEQIDSSLVGVPALEMGMFHG